MEETIAMLEARIHELENPAIRTQAVMLNQPYPKADPVSGSSQSGIVAAPIETLGMAGVFAGGITTGSEEYKEEPSPAVKAALLHTFVHHAIEIGFFLDVQRFIATTIQIDAQTNDNLPIPALISAACLWGLRLSRNSVSAAPGDEYRETVLDQAEAGTLSRALDQLSNAMSSPTHNRVVQTIQTEILLANYFFDNGRTLEGRHHISTAVGLTLGAGLNRARNQPRSPENVLTAMLPAPESAIEADDRIKAFWSVFVWDSLWSSALDYAPSLQLGDTPGQELKIDIPWPSDNTRSLGVSTEPIRRFLHGIEDESEGQSETALLAKTSVLMERTNALEKRYRPGMTPYEVESFKRNQIALDTVIQRLMVAIPRSNSPASLTLISVQMIAHTTRMKLHRIGGYGQEVGFEDSRRIAAEEAKSIADILEANPEASIYNPFLGPIYVSAALVLVDAVTMLKASDSEGNTQLRSDWSKAANVLVSAATNLRTKAVGDALKVAHKALAEL
ncbi:hypothetical protein HGRIS_005349 [Hohenbuehelia grisea]|uniref:Xylanolytic transcriptional activator regulatory domain-containing protein n=1 Tax=Hohenbuehelia grisea TaxID=104357 RepID=A0ABR3JG92_9AGAR